MPEARPDTARLEARLVVLLLVELPTLVNWPEDNSEDRLELVIDDTVDIYFFLFYSPWPGAFF
jgi:hypothetical protein